MRKGTSGGLGIDGLVRFGHIVMETHPSRCKVCLFLFLFFANLREIQVVEV